MIVLTVWRLKLAKTFLEVEDFLKVDIRTGTITHSEINKETRQPALKLWIDFGPIIGERKTSAKLAELYSPENLKGKQIMAIVNFKPKQIASFMSEVLILGFSDEENQVVLAIPDKKVPNGMKLF